MPNACKAVSRRGAILGGLAVGTFQASTLWGRPQGSRLVAAGLLAPESPKPMADGSVLFVEMVRKTLSRVNIGGSVDVVALFPAAPNACAVGPDGAIYLTINGASVFKHVGQDYVWSGTTDPGGLSQIAKVDLASRRVRTLYASNDGLDLVAPNDLVFDGLGGFYFTDTGAKVLSGPTGAVYYAASDGSHVARLCDIPLANGVILSPDRSRLRICSGKIIVECMIEAPGKLGRDGAGAVKRITFAKTELGMFDSMAALADGGILAGRLHPGGLGHFGPNGSLVELIPFAGENAVTNVGMGGADMRSAYVSLTESGRIVEMRSRKSGLRLAYS